MVIHAENAHMKRYRAPKARPGQLKAQWGKMPHESPDLCYAWGDGVSSADGRLLHNALSSKTYSPIDKTWDDSFLEELDKRGYDITTLTFSVQKKAV